MVQQSLDLNVGSNPVGDLVYWDPRTGSLQFICKRLNALTTSTESLPVVKLRCKSRPGLKVTIKKDLPHFTTPK
ncbi:hypothetical protein J6590_049004 [Homalodisca vitripennis]|nr:hypothetical protein J6590_049004 [Homalodisca vitripennis]